jgi:hypothetical protein
MRVCGLGLVGEDAVLPEFVKVVAADAGGDGEENTAGTN